MNKDLIFAIDCDEVLRGTLSTMVKIYNEEIGDAKKESDIKDFNVDISFPRIYNETGIPAAEWFFDCHSKELFLDSKPIKGVQKALRILKQYGKVVILTYQRSCENKLHTLEWLRRNKLLCDDICFLKDKYLLHCDYMVDDNVLNFKNSNTKNAILITAPYNENYVDLFYETDSNSTHKGEVDVALATIMRNWKINSAMRFSSLAEFAKYIDEMYKTKEIEYND